MLFSPFQHLSLFLIMIYVDLSLHGKIYVVFFLSTNAPNINMDLHCRDRMVDWSTTTCAISDYHH